jgi:hypothetical protein
MSTAQRAVRHYLSSFSSSECIVVRRTSFWNARPGFDPCCNCRPKSAFGCLRRVLASALALAWRDRVQNVACMDEIFKCTGKVLNRLPGAGKGSNPVSSKVLKRLQPPGNEGFLLEPTFLPRSGVSLFGPQISCRSGQERYSPAPPRLSKCS